MWDVGCGRVGDLDNYLLSKSKQFSILVGKCSLSLLQMKISDYQVPATFGSF